MRSSPSGSLLLVVPLATDLPTRLFERAMLVAGKKNLDVVVYCHVPSTPAPHTDVSAGIEPDAENESRDRAKSIAYGAAQAFRKRGIAACAYIGTQESPLRGALDVIARERSTLLMMRAEDYDAWSDGSLAESGLVESYPVPIWVVNGARGDTAVIGALQLRARESIPPLDRRVAQEAVAVAADLGAETHIVHSLKPHAEVPQFLETALPGTVIDAANQDLENHHAKMAHIVADHFRIAPENVHLDSSEFADALTNAAEAVNAGVVVIGAKHRLGLRRMLFKSAPHRLLDRLDADLLIVNQMAA